MQLPRQPVGSRQRLLLDRSPVFAAGSAGVRVLAVAVGSTMGVVALPVAVIDVGLMTLP